MKQDFEHFTDSEDLAIELDDINLLSDDRKVRLFICQTCRLVWDKLPKIAQNALLIAEKYIDGNSTTQNLIDERVKLWTFLEQFPNYPQPPEAHAVRAVMCALYEKPMPDVEKIEYVRSVIQNSECVENKQKEQCKLLIDLFVKQNN